MGKKYALFTPEEKARHRLKVAKWRKANPEKVRAWEAAKRAKRPRPPPKARKPRAKTVFRTPEEILLRNKDANYRKLGISLSVVVEILASQGGRCAICERDLDISHLNTSLKCPNVDHCHTTMKIRGVLCRPCNQWLGLYETNKAFLQKSDTYLDNRPQWGDLKPR